ncbi:MAG: hypothetical protein AAF579_23985 [Cyanobacteria bacterium P01_C01_bin.118]
MAWTVGNAHPTNQTDKQNFALSNLKIWDKNTKGIGSTQPTGSKDERR